jgi:hypothetical protein
MTIGSRGHDRTLGVACLIACPAITGLFLGLVAIVCASPAADGNAVALGIRVGAIAFAVNAIAICFTACAQHLHAGHRARREAVIALDVARSRVFGNAT